MPALPALPEHLDAAIELVHRVAGYPLAFVVAPIAIATFAGKPGHHWAGKAYAIGMTFLYLTGTTLTLTRHAWGTWEFGRNVVFNLVGYSLLLHGFRSMWLVTHPQTARPTMLDRVLHVFSVIAIALVVLKVRDWRAGFTRPVLYRRHIRYMLGSYFYVLTVVSLVHLKDELSSDARWLWPSILAVVVISLVGEGRRAIACLG